MKKISRYLLAGLGLMLFISSCSNDLKVVGPEYSDDIWETREYKVQRHPTVIRNGFGMDLLHTGSGDLDVLYMTEESKLEYPYDLMFSSEMAYSKNSAGEWTGTGNPVVFLADDVKAAMVGSGITDFENFTAADIAQFASELKYDPVIDIESTLHYHDDSCTPDADGNYTHEEGFPIQNLIRAEYKKLIIGTACCAHNPQRP